MTTEKPKTIEAELEPGEGILATVSAFSGILAIPFIVSAPPLGSTRWKLAITDQRLIAVENPFIRKPRLAPVSARFEGIHIRVHWMQGVSANLTIEGEVERRLKIYGWPVQVHEFLKCLRDVVPPDRIDG